MISRFLLLPGLLGALSSLAPRPALAQEPGKPWPQEFRARPAKIAPLDPPEGTKVAYQTAHFRLLCDDPIAREPLKGFATVIESVPRVLRGLPLPLWAPPGEEKPVIRLCRDELRYQALGGPGRSPGFYSGRKQEVLIRADVFLNPPLLKPSRLVPKPNEHLLVHELTHLGMHGILAKSRPWFYEGVAEYVSAAHRTGGNYSFSDMDRRIRDHIRKYIPPAEDGKIALPSLAATMAKDSRQWRDTNEHTDGNTPIRQYAAALLLVHYHFHGKTRRAEVHRYLERLAAYRDFRQPLPKLATEETTEIERRLQRYWLPKGLNLEFARAASRSEVP